MEKREEILRLLASLLKGGAALEEAVRSLERELLEALLGDMKRQLGEEALRAFYELRTPAQPSAEELKAEIARAMGLEGEDLYEALRRALRGSEGARSDEVREGAPQGSGEAEDR
ncbi:MAG: hypothetical protein N3F67_05140 [Acidilobaceae archaeon]|nr:hypothetical protein [Acidilobaceae archaeon]